MVSGLVLGVMFQNCSKVSIEDTVPNSTNKIMSDGPVTASDMDGNQVPVIVDNSGGSPEPQSPSQPTTTTTTTQPTATTMPTPTTTLSSSPSSPGSSEDHPEPSTPPGAVDGVQKEELTAYCGFDVKTIQQLVDVAQFKDQDVNLELIKGKTMIYSSDGEVELKSLTISSAVGRTILCGVKVDSLNVKKGRLEVYYSEIKEILDMKGRLIKDEHSKLPAGY
jgi:hypothetical protein